jgi:hypothetical protein
VAKRVSLKGKGADIFFGDYAPPGMSMPETIDDDVPVVDSPTADTPESDDGLAVAASTTAANAVAPTTTDSIDQNDVQAAPSPGPKDESKKARKQEGTLARKPAGIRASKHDGVQENTPDEGTASIEHTDAQGDVIRVSEIAADVWTRVDMPATITNSFRYTESELSTLTDVLYEVGKLHGAKLTKQDVARLGLNVILDEYRRRGAGSLLGTLAARRRQRRGGGS